MQQVTYAFKDYIQNGLGADLVRLTGLMAKAEANNLVLCFIEDDVWEHTPESSDNRGWTFYFEETLPVVKSAPRLGLSGFEKTPLPEGEESKFAYRSRLMKSLYRPRQEFQKRVDSHIRNNLSVLLENDYTLIHIRRGDKVKGPWRESQIIPVEKYLQFVKGKGLVFIMTDSPEVIREIEAKVTDYPDIEFLWDKSEIRRDGYSYKLHEFGYSDEEKIDEMVTNMKNLWLMQHASALIGARSSFLFITGELLNGQPGISLENNIRYPTDL